MSEKQTDNFKTKFNLVKSMLPHVPFDGWSWQALEQGATEIGFENKKTFASRMEIYQYLFENGSIDFIDIFSQIIDEDVKNLYKLKNPKPITVPEKIKTIILMRLFLCKEYKEAIRSSLPITGLPKNSKKSIKILYRTCNSIWRISGDKSTDFSFYTKRISLAAVYTSTLFFWLNDDSKNQVETSFFLDRRLNDISKISNLKKPFKTIKKVSDEINKSKNTMKVKSFFEILKKINQIKKSSFS